MLLSCFVYFALNSSKVAVFLWKTKRALAKGFQKLSREYPYQCMACWNSASRLGDAFMCRTET